MSWLSEFEISPTSLNSILYDSISVVDPYPPPDGIIPTSDSPSVFPLTELYADQLNHDIQLPGDPIHYQMTSSYLPQPITSSLSRAPFESPLEISIDQILASDDYIPPEQVPTKSIISPPAIPSLSKPTIYKSVESNSQQQQQHKQQQQQQLVEKPRPTSQPMCDIIRITWLTNSNKSGWVPISPFPRAISKQKKIVVEPVRIESEDLKLFISLETQGEQQLQFASCPYGNHSPADSLEFSVCRTDTSSETNCESHEILLNCNYIRPPQNKGRPLQHLIISDNYGRQLLNWSVEIFNPKWETMTKSQDKPTIKKVCTVAWCDKDEWKIATRTLVVT